MGARAVAGLRRGLLDQAPSDRGETIAFAFAFVQGAAVPSLEKIPEPIKEATALFYGERQGLCPEVLAGTSRW